jgi:predicted nucleotidyltransferase
MLNDLKTWSSVLAVWANDKPKIAEVWLFGSRVRGDHHDESDLDIALVMAGEGQDVRYNDWFWAADDWKEELKLLLPVPIDLQLGDEDISTSIVGPAIRREGVRVFSRERKKD